MTDAPQDNKLATTDDAMLRVRVEQHNVELTSNQLRILRNAFKQDFSDPQLLWIGEYCAAMQLNPFKGEIHFWSDRGKVVPYIGIPAWYKRMYEHPLFEHSTEFEVAGTDGKWSEVWVPRKDEPQPYVGRIGIKRKDQQAVVYEISYFKEKFQPGKPAWQQNPLSMFKDRCVAAACRRHLADTFSGLYMDGELVETDADPQQATPKLKNSILDMIDAADTTEQETPLADTAPADGPVDADWTDVPADDGVQQGGLDDFPDDPLQKMPEELEDLNSDVRGKELFGD